MADHIDEALLLTLAGAATAHARALDLLRVTASTCHQHGIGVERIAAVMRAEHDDVQRLIESSPGDGFGPQQNLTL